MDDGFMTDSDIPLIGWISDTRPQGCTDLQSPVKCLDHKYCDGYSMQSCKAVLGCAMHCVTLLLAN